MEDEYLYDEVASDSEDEKSIRAAENRAVKKMKTHKKETGKQNRKRPAEAAGSFTQIAHDGGNGANYNATQPFPATGAVPRLQRIPRQATSATNAEVMDIETESTERYKTAVNSELAEDLLCKKTNRDFLEVDNAENLDTFYEYESGISDINVKGRLKKSVEFWEQIGTSKFILDVIKEGCTIPLLDKPEKTFLKK